MNTLLMTRPATRRLLLAAGLLMGAAALNVHAQDRSYARQNGESRIQGSERSRAVAPAASGHKRGDSRGNYRGGSRDQRSRAVPGNHRQLNDQRGRSNSRSHAINRTSGSYGHQGRRDNSRYTGGRQHSGRQQHDYRRSAPAYGARDYRPRNHNYQNNYRHDYRDNRRGHWRSPGWRSQWTHGWSGNRHRAASRYYYPSGYSSFRWTVGYVLPRAFYRSNYYVNYDAYGLAPPPYGTRWLRVDSDLLLVDIHSYEIIDVLRGFYYY